MDKSLIKKYLPFLLIIVITIVVTGIISPKLDFLKNSEIKNLEKDKKELTKERDLYLEDANRYKKSSEQYQEEFNRLDSLNQLNEKELEIRNRYIILMRTKLDSLNIKIDVSDSVLAKLDKEEYEILNNTDDGSINEHKQFFTNRLQ